MNNRFLVSNSWTELIQSGCEILEVESIQPLGSSTLNETLCSLKALWARLSLLDSPISPSLCDLILRDCKSPFAKLHPIGRVLTFLLLKKIGSSPSPLVPMCPLMPLFELCQLALLWAIAGEEKEALSLASKLLPLSSLPTLWCKEEEFSEREVAFSISLFKRAFGYPTEIPKEAIDPFFLALAKGSPHWENRITTLPHRIVDPDFGLSFQKNDRFAAVVTLAGERSALGSFYTEEAEIRAFGPQIPPLNNPQGFGILRLPDSQPMERWTAVAALPEIWMETHVQFERTDALISIRFLGQSVEKPLYFSFYIKAPQCQIDEETLLPRTLKRYQGETKEVLFGGKLKIESLLPAKMEVIPLAGAGGFWNSDFLLAFEIPSFEARAEYRLHF